MNKKQMLGWLISGMLVGIMICCCCMVLHQQYRRYNYNPLIGGWHAVEGEMTMDFHSDGTMYIYETDNDVKNSRYKKGTYVMGQDYYKVTIQLEDEPDRTVSFYVQNHLTIEDENGIKREFRYTY